MINPEKIRNDFPALERTVNGRSLAYLDNAATTQKPETVLERIQRYYSRENANVGRSMHDLSSTATQVYRDSRRKVAEFLNADTGEVVFKKNTTEAMNFLARSLEVEQKIVVSEMSHHSALLPFRQKAAREGLELEYIPMKNYTVDTESAKEIIDSGTGLVVLGHVSNVFGTENPVEEIVEIAHDHGAKVVVDGAQSLPRQEVDARGLGADFFAFSGHKMLGPMGSGGLYGREELLEAVSPSDFGGGMIRKVTRNKSKWRESPERFEAGTPDVAAAAGLAEAVNYLEEIGMDEIESHERKLVSRATRQLEEIDRANILARGKENSLVSFNVEDVHPHDVAEIFNQRGIAVRAGKHCAHPALDRLGIPGTVRISPYLYNSENEMERAVKAVEKAAEMF